MPKTSNHGGSSNGSTQERWPDEMVVTVGMLRSILSPGGDPAPGTWVDNPLGLFTDAFPGGVTPNGVVPRKAK